MPVLNVHISYGPDDDFLGRDWKEWIAVGHSGSAMLSSICIQAVPTEHCPQL